MPLIEKPAAAEPPGRLSRELRQPDVVRQDERELAEQAVPGEPAGEGGRERRNPGGLLLLERGRLRHGRGRHRRRGELGLSSVTPLLVVGDARARGQEPGGDDGRHEHRARDAADEDGVLAPLRRATLTTVVSWEEVDGPHDSIPRPIATASEPNAWSEPTFLPSSTRASGSPTRTRTPIRRPSSASSPGS